PAATSAAMTPPDVASATSTASASGAVRATDAAGVAVDHVFTARPRAAPVGLPAASGDEGGGYRRLAQRVAQHRPVHGLVAEDARRGLRQFAIVEQRHRAEIGADGPLLEPRGETQHVGLRLQLVGR